MNHIYKIRGADICAPSYLDALQLRGLDANQEAKEDRSILGDGEMLQVYYESQDDIPGPLMEKLIALKIPSTLGLWWYGEYGEVYVNMPCHRWASVHDVGIIAGHRLENKRVNSHDRRRNSHD